MPDDAIIHLRVPAGTKARWVRQAQREGQKLSDWISQRMDQAVHPKVTTTVIIPGDGIASADVDVQRAVIAEREACAKVCDDKAMRCETRAQEAIEAGEHDEVSAIRSTAWQISVCADAIRARGAA